jgi:pilus assembly protein CpaE
MVIHEMSAEGVLVWAAPEASACREIVGPAARELKLGVRFCTHRELFERLHAERASVVCLEFGYDPHPGLALLKQVVERMPRLTTLVASSDTSVAMIRSVLEAGAADFLTLPLNPQELSKTLIKLSQTAMKSPTRGQDGNIITVCGARGGLGATTLAVNLAFALTTQAGVDTALVDLDLQRGDVAAFLNLTPLNSIATLAEAKGPVDDIFLAGTLTRHPRGVFVLPAPPQVEEADTVGHDHVELALQLLRSQFRYTVVDTARTVSGPIMAAFEQSDHILVLTDLSVPGVRAARRLMELIVRLGPGLERVHPIFSHVIPGPVSAQDAARAIGKEPFLVMPRDDSTASGAMNGGIPLNGKQSALSHAIAQLASKLAGVAPPRAKGLLQRVFGKEARR